MLGSRIFDTTRETIVEVPGVDVEEVTPDAKLHDDLGADDLAVLQLTQALEEAFGIKAPPGADFGTFTVGQIAAYLLTNA